MVTLQLTCCGLLPCLRPTEAAPASKFLPPCHIFPDLMTLMITNRVNGSAITAGVSGMKQRKTGKEPWFG
jgi:hypothetical protein